RIACITSYSNKRRAMEFPTIRLTTYISSIISSRLKVIAASHSKSEIEINRRSIFYNTDFNEDVDLEFRKSTFYITDLFDGDEYIDLQPNINLLSNKQLALCETQEFTLGNEDNLWENKSNVPVYKNVHQIQQVHQLHPGSSDDTCSYDGSFWSDDTDIEVDMGSDEEHIILHQDESPKDEIQCVLNESDISHQNATQPPHVAHISINENNSTLCSNKCDVNYPDFSESRTQTHKDLESNVSIVLNNNVSVYLDNQLKCCGISNAEDETDNKIPMRAEIIRELPIDMPLCSLNDRPKQRPVPPPKPKKKPLVPPKPKQTQELVENLQEPFSSSKEKHITNTNLSEFKCALTNDVTEYSLEHSIEQPMYYSCHFKDEPLYQFYEDDAKIEHDYECTSIGYYAPVNFLQRRLSAMKLVTPPSGLRRLWCQLPEVIQSGVLDSMSNDDIRLQEAMFEVVTSEASYLKSLYVLISHFAYCPDLMVEDVEDPILTQRQRKDLFSSIIPVKRCSEQFLADLEMRWQESVKISSLSDIVIKHIRSQFHLYIKYCTHQIHQERTLKDLKSTNKRFAEILSSLESAKICQSQSLHSFLILPMQRITRFPLLMAAILRFQKSDSPEWEETEQALFQLNMIVRECNESMRKIEEMEEMLTISQQLNFQGVRAFPILSASRYLLDSEDFTRLTWLETDANSIFATKLFKEEICILLFNDHLVFTRKKKDSQYIVLDHCSRNMVRMMPLDDESTNLPLHIQTEYKNLIIMTIVQNHEDKISEMVLACSSKSKQKKWVENLSPFLSKSEDEVVYQHWDLPLIQVTYPYEANQEGDITLMVSDIFEVRRMRLEGWYEGKRVTDGYSGWFPVSHTEEMLSLHMRARHLWQRYQLLAASGSLLQQIQRERELHQHEDKKRVRKRLKSFIGVVS
ncbi:unnamed protein product, partial [Meganyctiphanes norvegica]